MQFPPWLAIATFLLAPFASFAAPATGPLRPSAENPRYFADPSGKIIYVTGLHTWANLQDQGANDPPPKFDFDRYLDQLEKYHHNFIRLWSWEQARWAPWSDGKEKNPGDWYITPNPYARTGPGAALDGKSKFDLEKFDEAYFVRLRERVQKAGARGIYVSIMLFQGWSSAKAWIGGKPWDGHPFNPANNIQNFNGNPGGNSGPSLDLKSVRERQAKYLRKVIDTVNDLDNVLYEVTNEGGNKDWDWWVVDTVHVYEKQKPKQHSIGLTAHGSESNDDMLASAADWFSPGSSSWPDLKTDPREYDGNKPSLVDTDHVWGVGGSPEWVWKIFTRGHNLLFMDPYNDPQWEPILTGQGVRVEDPEGIRRAMGYARKFAERLNLAHTRPAKSIASTGYCLTDGHSEYLIYQPAPKQSFTAKVSAATYRFEWFNPKNGTTASSGEIKITEAETRFSPLFESDAILYLKKQ
jgi:hypothetical protein